MGKRTEKRPYGQYNQDVIGALVKKYGMSAYYIKQCVAGRCDGIMPDKIRKDYRSLSKSLKDITDKRIDQFLTK